MRYQRATQPRILFLDQTGELGGAQLLLADIAPHYPGMVLTFQDGPFPKLLRDNDISVEVLPAGLANFRRDSSLMAAVVLIKPLIKLICTISKRAMDFDVIYTNGQKAALTGLLAGALSQKPVIVHLHDILDSRHFSSFNRCIFRLATNLLATKVIVNSQASAEAFINAGGCQKKMSIVYNGFVLDRYQTRPTDSRVKLRQSANLKPDSFVIGCFSRLAKWKGQLVLLQALPQLPQNVSLILVGGALFGEESYKVEIEAEIQRLQLQDRVHLLGFRSDVVELMQICDVIAHPSIDPEPFGRTIVEAQLLAKPVIATAHGGVLEIIEDDKTGQLVKPKSSEALAQAIQQLLADPAKCQSLGDNARTSARQKFDIAATFAAIDKVLQEL